MPKEKKSATKAPSTRESLSGTIKTIRNIMRKDKGLNGDLDRLPMLTWLMFLKFLDDSDELHRVSDELAGRAHIPLIEEPYRWRDWAANQEGLTGPELISFINQDEAMRPDGTRGPGLFAYLKTRSGGRGDVLANVFRELQNRMSSGYLLRDVVNKISEISFGSSESIHTLSHLYESMLKEMRDAAGDSGEFYDLTDEEKAARGWRRVKLCEVMRLDLDPVKVDPLNRYRTAGCYSYARGLFHKEPVSGLEYQSPFLYRMKAGQFTYLKLKAFEGSFAFVSPEFDGCCVSNEYPMFTMDPSVARAEWLFVHFKAPRTWAGLASSSKGIGARRERVNPTAMLAHEVWLPPIADQIKIAEVLNAKRQYDALDTFEKDAEALRRSILSKVFRGEL